MRRVFRIAACLAAVLCYHGAALGSTPEYWTFAGDRTKDITGVIRFDGSTLTFATGSSLRLRFIGRGTPSATILSLKKDVFPSPRVDVYRVVQPSNPLLLYGNNVCLKSVTFVVIVREPGKKVVALEPYDTSAEPREAKGLTPCSFAVYTSTMRANRGMTRATVGAPGTGGHEVRP